MVYLVGRISKNPYNAEVPQHGGGQKNGPPMDREAWSDRQGYNFQRYVGGVMDYERRKGIPKGYGICSRCEHLEYRITRFGNEKVGCSAYVYDKNPAVYQRPNKEDPIGSCSDFDEAGSMTIRDMERIATLIVPKKKIGFESQELEFISPTDDRHKKIRREDPIE